MMLLKYPNVYTATVFMDSPANYYDPDFYEEYGAGMAPDNLMDKVMFGSNLPRFRQVQN